MPNIKDLDRGPAFIFAPRVVRQRVMDGETAQQARSRWARERQIETDRDHEARRVFTGQVLPVRYDDE
jgi:hypothetical protein